MLLGDALISVIEHGALDLGRHSGTDKDLPLLGIRSGLL